MRVSAVGLWAFLVSACWGQPIEAPKPPWQNPDSVRAYLLPDTSYPFLRLSENRIFLAAHLRPFFQALYQNTQKLRVLHIGDSHIQGDVQGREIRKRLYALWGPGGRGYVFPYAIAGTSSAYDYTSLGQGQWIAARSAHFQPALPLGVTGMAIGTYDPSAQWELRWAPAYQPAAGAGARLSLLVRTLRPGVRLYLHLSDTLPAVELPLEAGYQRIEYILPIPLMQLRGGFRWEGSDSLAYAELQGLFIEEGNFGLTWYSMGVNGARLSDWATLPLLKESLRLLRPDLVVLDLGTNDLYAANATLAQLRQALEAALDTLRSAVPQASILLTTTQDFYRRMRPLPLLAQAAQLVHYVAAQKGATVWDAYEVLGSMREWRLAGLALPDMVHLTPAGYALKGQLLAGTLLQSYLAFLADSLGDPTLEARSVSMPAEAAQTPILTVPLTPSITQFSGSAATYRPTKPTYLTHRVKSGETLGQIAQKYRTSVAAIQQANGLRGSTIRVGQVLRIPTGASGGPSAASPSGGASGASKPSTSSGVRYHTVQPGESLWSIAQKYTISVDALCRANGLTLKSTVHPGQRLRIP